jgi:hypothetical protein
MEALMEAGWKAALVLLAGGVAAGLARRASAATRHLIWTAALGGALVLPLLSASLPRVPVRGLPEVLHAAIAEKTTPPASAVERSAGSSEARAATRAGDRAAQFPEVRPSRAQLTDAREARTDWPKTVRLLWATVAMALFLRIAAGDLQLRGIARRARRAVDSEWLDLIREGALIASQRLDARNQVEVIHQAARLGDYESAEVLLALSRRESLSGDALREYESAAKRLGDFSRNRVLAALHR